MAAIDLVKQHFQNLAIQQIAVEEWKDADGKPLVIYYKPITLAERQKFQTAGEREGTVAAYADVIVTKALDAEGKKLFTIADKQVFRHQADPDILRRVCLQMMVVPAEEEMGKDSSRIAASA